MCTAARYNKNTAARYIKKIKDCSFHKYSAIFVDSQAHGTLHDEIFLKPAFLIQKKF